jgi:SSS family solute:Na+ symporter
MHYLGFIIVYLVLVVAYGLYVGKKLVKTSEGFVTCERSLPLWIVIGTLIATWFGGGSITGCANIVYTRGIIGGLIYQYSTPIGLIVVFLIAGKIRAAENTTISALFKDRYGTLASILATIFIVLSYIGITSYQFKGAGYVLNIVTGMSVESGTVLAAVIIILLTVTGGLASVAYTDAISAVFIFVSFLIAIPCLLLKSGGLGGLVAQIPHEYFTWSGANHNSLTNWGVLFATAFLAMGDQNLFIRFNAAKNRKEATKSCALFIVGAVILGTMTVLIESFAIPYLKDIRPDTALLMIAMHHLPFFVGGFILAASIAFMVTTGDSFMLSAATTLSHDVVAPYITKNQDEKYKLKMVRIMVLVCGLLAYLLISQFKDILGIIMYAYTVYAAAITPALVAAFTWKRVTPAGGVCSIIVGGGSALIWELWLKNSYGGIDGSLIAIPCSILTIIVVSLLTQSQKVESELIK